MSKFAEIVGAEVSRKTREIKINLFTGVIMETRVDTGRLRGNWQMTPDAPADGELERLDKEGAGPIADVVQGVRADGVDYLTNNLSYAEPREQKDGMVAKTVARLERYVQEAIR